MKQEENVRLVVHIEPSLHKAAKAIAALRGITLRYLVEEAMRKQIEAKPPGADYSEEHAERIIRKAVQTLPPGETMITRDNLPDLRRGVLAIEQQELEDAVAAQLEKEVEKAKLEHERRVASGVIKG
jgi:hypothetical protein